MLIPSECIIAFLAISMPTLKTSKYQLVRRVLIMIKQVKFLNVNKLASDIWFVASSQSGMTVY